MAELLGQLGTKVLDKWWSMLGMPGVLFLAAVSASVATSAFGWADVRGGGPGKMTSQIDGWLHALQREPVRLILLCAAVLIGAAAAGFAARAFARMLAWVWFAAFPFNFILYPITVLRRAVWRRVHLLASKPGTMAQFWEARRNAVALAQPDSPTWAADRLSALVARIRHQYGVDLAAAWPRIWLLLSEQERTEVSNAVTAIDRAVGHGGWAALYLAAAAVLGGRGHLWWPLAAVGLGALLIAGAQVRSAAGAMAEIVEASVDLNLGALAERFGIPVQSNGLLAPENGELLTELLRKGT